MSVPPEHRSLGQTRTILPCSIPVFLAKATPCAGIRPSDSPRKRMRHRETPGPPVGNNSHTASHKLSWHRDMGTVRHNRHSHTRWPCSRRRWPAAGNRRTEPDRSPADRDRGSTCPRILPPGRFPPPDRPRPSGSKQCSWKGSSIFSTTPTVPRARGSDDRDSLLIPGYGTGLQRPIFVSTWALSIIPELPGSRKPRRKKKLVSRAETPGR